MDEVRDVIAGAEGTQLDRTCVRPGSLGSPAERAHRRGRSGPVAPSQST